MDGLFIRGSPSERSATYLSWQARPWLMRSPFVRGSPPGRLVTGMSSSIGNGWDILLSLPRHKLLLLLQPLHHSDQCLDLLRNVQAGLARSSVVGWGERLHHQIATFVMVWGESRTTSGGILCLSYHHFFQALGSSSSPLLGALICCHQITLNRTVVVP